MRTVHLYSQQDSSPIPRTPFWMLPGWPVVSVRWLMRSITHWVSLHQEVMCLGANLSLSLSTFLAYVLRFCVGSYNIKNFMSNIPGLQICLSMETSVENLAQPWDHHRRSASQNYPCTVHSVCLASPWGLSAGTWVTIIVIGHNTVETYSLIGFCEERLFPSGLALFSKPSDTLCGCSFIIWFPTHGSDAESFQLHPQISY